MASYEKPDSRRRGNLPAASEISTRGACAADTPTPAPTGESEPARQSLSQLATPDAPRTYPLEIERLLNLLDEAAGLSVGTISTMFAHDLPRSTFDAVGPGESADLNYPLSGHSPCGWAWSKTFLSRNGLALTLTTHEPPAGWTPPYRACPDCGAQLDRQRGYSTAEDYPTCRRCAKARNAGEDQDTVTA